MTSNASFFREREAPAVLKHGILKRYPTVFASAAGKKASRVVLLDGYAGRGRYEDGTPGSPLLLLATAANTQSFRDVECRFVERDKANFAELRQVIEDRSATEVRCDALEGDLSDHLDAILIGASNAALFAFLDPFGTALGYDELTARLLGRPEHPPTEVLLHVSVGAIRRIGGLLRKRGAEPESWSSADTKTIARVDRFLGGEWWHEIAHSAMEEEGVATKIAAEVVERYCVKVGADTKYASFRFPVCDRPDLVPEYFLVLFARHPYAFWRFNDALSKANVEWQEAWRGKVNKKAADKALAKATAKVERTIEIEREQGIVSLFGDEFPLTPTAGHHAELPPFDENAEAERWVATIEANLTDLLRQGTPFRLMDMTGPVYGDVLGQAREMHVKRALGNLHARGISPDNGKGNDVHKRLIRPSCPLASDPVRPVGSCGQ